MWEHGGCLESVKQDAISRYDHLDCYDIWTCEMWARAEGTGIISGNTTGRCATKRFYFCGVLNACASMVALEEGRCAHEQIIQSGLESDVFVGSSLVDMYAKCGSMEDAWSVFNKMPSRNVVTWTAILGGCAMHGHDKEALKHFEWTCEEGVQPRSHFCVFCQVVAMKVWWMKACGVMLQWSQSIQFLQIQNTTPAWLTFLTVLAIYRRQRIWSWKCPVNHMWVLGWPCSALAEFMVMWRWQNMLQSEFLTWSLTVLLVMCCCQTSMLLLATGTSVRMLYGRERKKV
jgi:pentatricopeptide repeat protein